MRRLSMLLLLLLLTANGAQAQATEASTGPQGEAALVTFFIRGNVYASGASTYVLPLSVLEALEQQPSLRHLTVEGKDALHEGVARIEARFAFASLKAFRTWYQDEQTQAMLAALRGQRSPASLEYALQVDRPAARGTGNE